jgi:hypothetical protein
MRYERCGPGQEFSAPGRYCVDSPMVSSSPESRIARSRREALLFGIASNDAASVTVMPVRAAEKQRRTAAAFFSVAMRRSHQVPLFGTQVGNTGTLWRGSGLGKALPGQRRRRGAGGAVLRVKSRQLVERVHFERRRIALPSVADGLQGGVFPAHAGMNRRSFSARLQPPGRSVASRSSNAAPQTALAVQAPSRSSISATSMPAAAHTLAVWRSRQCGKGSRHSSRRVQAIRPSSLCGAATPSSLPRVPTAKVTVTRCDRQG